MQVDAIAKALFESKAIKFGEFTLTSGKKSPYYVDLRVVPSFPGQCKVVIEAYAEVVQSIGIENCVLVGVPTAGIAFAAMLGAKINKPMAFVRKEKREHGTGKQVEGIIQDGQEVILVDDLITTGKSNLKALEFLRSDGYSPKHIIVLVDRMQGGKKNVEAQDAVLHAGVDIIDLAQSLASQGMISQEQLKTVKEYVEAGT